MGSVLGFNLWTMNPGLPITFGVTRVVYDWTFFFRSFHFPLDSCDWIVLFLNNAGHIKSLFNIPGNFSNHILFHFTYKYIFKKKKGVAPLIYNFSFKFGRRDAVPLPYRVPAFLFRAHLLLLCARRTPHPFGPNIASTIMPIVYFWGMLCATPELRPICDETALTISYWTSAQHQLDLHSRCIAQWMRVCDMGRACGDVHTIVLIFALTERGAQLHFGPLGFPCSVDKWRDATASHTNVTF